MNLPRLTLCGSCQGKLCCSPDISKLQCRSTALTDGPGNKIKSHRNGVFSFSFGFGLDLFVLVEVTSRLMFAIRLKCVELEEVTF